MSRSEWKSVLLCSFDIIKRISKMKMSCCLDTLPSLIYHEIVYIYKYHRLSRGPRCGLTATLHTQLLMKPIMVSVRYYEDEDELRLVYQYYTQRVTYTQRCAALCCPVCCLQRFVRYLRHLL